MSSHDAQRSSSAGREHAQLTSVENDGESGSRELFRLTTGAEEFGRRHSGDHSLFARWAQPAVLCGMALLFVWLLTSGNISNYINTRFVAYTYIGAAALLALAGYSVLTALGRVRLSHSHSHVTWAVAGLVAVPLIFGAIAPSQPLAASAVTEDLNAAALARVDSSTVSTSNTEDWNVLDWLQSFYVMDDPAALNGRPAEVVGFVRKQEGGDAGSFRVSRFLVSCCVADTVSIGMPARAADGIPPTEGEWVRVTGTVTVAEVNGETLPVITNATFTVLSEPPKPPYLYP